MADGKLKRDEVAKLDQDDHFPELEEGLFAHQDDKNKVLAKSLGNGNSNIFVYGSVPDDLAATASRHRRRSVLSNGKSSEDCLAQESAPCGLTGKPSTESAYDTDSDESDCEIPPPPDLDKLMEQEASTIQNTNPKMRFDIEKTGGIYLNINNPEEKVASTDKTEKETCAVCNCNKPSSTGGKQGLNVNINFHVYGIEQLGDVVNIVQNLNVTQEDRPETGEEGVSDLTTQGSIRMRPAVNVRNGEGLFEVGIEEDSRTVNLQFHRGLGPQNLWTSKAKLEKHYATPLRWFITIATIIIACLLIFVIVNGWKNFYKTDVDPDQEFAKNHQTPS